MLTLEVDATEMYDETTGEFSLVGGRVIELEHSLVSLSKWEAIHHKPFLGNAEKTVEQLYDYIWCMILTPGFSRESVRSLDQRCVDAIQEYIQDPQSATTFGQHQDGSGPKETITAELIYYWMTAFDIPPDYENWHLNRLFSLIRIANIKNSPPKKQDAAKTAANWREINAQRKAAMGTSG